MCCTIRQRQRGAGRFKVPPLALSEDEPGGEISESEAWSCRGSSFTSDSSCPSYSGSDCGSPVGEACSDGSAFSPAAAEGSAPAPGVDESSAAKREAASVEVAGAPAPSAAQRAAVGRGGAPCKDGAGEAAGRSPLNDVSNK